MRTTSLLLAAVLAAALFSGCDSILLSRPPGTESTSHATDPKLTGIWLLGGVSGATVSTTVTEVDLYDPAANSWYPAVTSLPTPVSFAGYAAYNGKLYVIGGYDSAGNAQTAVQIYNVAANSWSLGADLAVTPHFLQARANINIAQKGDRFLILGGTAAAASAAYSGNLTTYEYNATLNSWTSKGSFGSTLIDRGALIFDDAIFNFGGRSTVTAMVNTHDRLLYTPMTTTATGVLLSAARTQMSAVMYRPASSASFMLLIGGLSALAGTNGNFVFHNAISVGTTFLNTVQYLLYPFATPSAWLPGTSFPSSVACSAAQVQGSRVYVFGGAGAVPPTGTSQTYSSSLANPASLAWTSLTNMPRQRYGHGAVTLNQ